MPFVVTTKRPDSQPYNPAHANIWRPVSRRALTTLEEAREAVSDAIDAHGGSGGRSFVWSVESGGTVGPLPDGTVIEVESVSFRDLAHRADFRWQTRRPDDIGAEILAAFNAREGTRA